MNFQQLRYIRETVRQGLNLTEAAAKLFTSQPGVSKQIRELEHELGVEIFVRRGKGSNDTTLNMAPRLVEMLRRRRTADPQGDHIYPRHVGKQCAVTWFRAAVKRANLSQVDGTVTPHTFRHTFAARLLHHGMGLEEVKEMLGHKNIQSTMIYAHLQPNRAAVRTAAIFTKIDLEREKLEAMRSAEAMTPEQVAAAYAGVASALR